VFRGLWRSEWGEGGPGFWGGLMVGWTVMSLVTMTLMGLSYLGARMGDRGSVLALAPLPGGSGSGDPSLGELDPSQRGRQLSFNQMLPPGPVSSTCRRTRPPGALPGSPAQRPPAQQPPAQRQLARGLPARRSPAQRRGRRLLGWTPSLCWQTANQVLDQNALHRGQLYSGSTVTVLYSGQHCTAAVQ